MLDINQKIGNEKRALQIEIIRSARKTMSMELDMNLRLKIRAPYRTSEAEICRFIEMKSAWIEKTAAKLEARRKEMQMQPSVRLSEVEIRALGQKALEYIPARTAFFAEKMGLSWGRITIRCQKTRWGSCSAKGNLNFNCLLMLAPPEVIDYVVVHELCHLKEMNHSARFWREVEQVLPDYKERRAWLRAHEGELMRRCFG